MSDKEREVMLVLSEDTARNLALDLFHVPNPDPSTVSVHADLIRLFPDVCRPLPYRSARRVGLRLECE